MSCVDDDNELVVEEEHVALSTANLDDEDYENDDGGDGGSEGNDEQQPLHHHPQHPAARTSTRSRSNPNPFLPCPSANQLACLLGGIMALLVLAPMYLPQHHGTGGFLKYHIAKQSSKSNSKSKSKSKDDMYWLPRPDFPQELHKTEGGGYQEDDFWNEEYNIRVPFWNAVANLGFQGKGWRPTVKTNELEELDVDDEEDDIFGDADDAVFFNKLPQDKLQEKEEEKVDQDDVFALMDDDYVFLENQGKSLHNPEMQDKLTNQSLPANTTYHLPGVRPDAWGPCFPPIHPSSYNWTLFFHNNNASFTHELQYPPKPLHRTRNPDLRGMCRPGFLIIGAGKCGTSSLYHYLIKHPRVLPASQKQIGYFTYELHRGPEWYLSHFPTTHSFLTSSALLTGEAFPGYLPYPQTAYQTSKLLQGVRVVCLVRNPLQRMYSSYRYNYLHEAVKALRYGRDHGRRRGGSFIKGKHEEKEGVPKGQPEEYYLQHAQSQFFSFEEFIVAELTHLRTCLAPGGDAERYAVKHHSYWAGTTMAQRLGHANNNNNNNHKPPPMVDLEACYGRKNHASKAPRVQWQDMVKAHPEKIINVPKTMHLFEALIGRSLYALALEWWFAAFAQEQQESESEYESEKSIHVMCLEELDNGTMNELAGFLGLKKFDFGEVLGEGRYNVGGHRGYDRLTTPDEMEEAAFEEGEGREGSGSNVNSQGGEGGDGAREVVDDVPLSKEVRKELEEFLSGYNERLFRLVGKRCPW